MLYDYKLDSVGIAAISALLAHVAAFAFILYG